jgi:HK97 family phage major capsid protein
MNDKIKKYALENLHSFTFEMNEVKVDQEKRIIPMTFFKPYLVTKWWGNLKLLTKKENVKLERWTQKQGAPFLKDHLAEDQRGIILNGYLNKDGVLGGDVKFSRNPSGEELMTDIVDGIRPYSSVGFDIKKIREMAADDMSEEEKNLSIETQMPIYEVDLWEPVEGSSVYSGAVPTVGAFGYDFYDLKKKEEIIELLKEFGLPVKFDQKINTNSNTKIKDTKMEKTAEQLAEETRLANEKAAIKLNEDNARKEEQRKASITRLAADFKEKVKNVNLEALRDLYIKEGNDSKEFAKQIGDLIVSESKAVAKPTVELSNKEVKLYSLLGAVRASMNPGLKCFERELSDEYAKNSGQTPSGIFLPHNAILPKVGRGTKSEKFDLLAGTATHAAELVGTDHIGSMFIDYLYEKMVLDNLTLMPGRKGNVEIPVLDASAGHGWAATEAATTAEGAPTTTERTATPKRGGRYIDITKQLMIQSDPAAESIFVNDLIKSLALGVQNAVLNGDGTGGAPTGVKSTTGIGAVGSIASMDWAKAVDFETLIDDSLGDDTGMYYVTRRAHRGALKSRVKETGQATYICENNVVNGYQMRTTNLVTAGDMFFGDWSQVIIPMWDGVDIIFDPYTNAPSGLVRITANQLLDIIVRYPSAFSYGSSFS